MSPSGRSRPSCGNATTSTSTSPRRRSRISSSPLIGVSLPITSTSANARTTVLPAARHSRTARDERSAISSTVPFALKFQVNLTASSRSHPGRFELVAKQRLVWMQVRVYERRQEQIAVEIDHPVGGVGRVPGTRRDTGDAAVIAPDRDEFVAVQDACILHEQLQVGSSGSLRIRDGGRDQPCPSNAARPTLSLIPQSALVPAVFNARETKTGSIRRRYSALA